MIEGTLDGRRFSLDFSGERLKTDFEDKEDKEFLLGFSTYCYHPIEGPGVYTLKENMISAQACIDYLIGSGIPIVLTKGISEPHSQLNFE